MQRKALENNPGKHWKIIQESTVMMVQTTEPRRNVFFTLSYFFAPKLKPMIGWLPLATPIPMENAIMLTFMQSPNVVKGISAPYSDSAPYCVRRLLETNATTVDVRLLKQLANPRLARRPDIDHFMTNEERENLIVLNLNRYAILKLRCP